MIIGHIFFTTSSFVHHFKSIREFKLKLQSWNAQFRSKLATFLSCVTLKFDGWPWETIGDFFCITSSFVHHFNAMGEFKLELQSGNAQFGSKPAIFCPWPCDLEIWRMTLKNNRAPLLCCFKFCASFHSHQWFQTRVTVWKWPIWVKIDDFFVPLSRVTLKFDRWPWKIIGHLFYATSNFGHHSVAVGEFKLELQSETPNLGQNWPFFLAVWPWNLMDDLEKQ